MVRHTPHECERTETIRVASACISAADATHNILTTCYHLWCSSIRMRRDLTLSWVWPAQLFGCTCALQTVVFTAYSPSSSHIILNPAFHFTQLQRRAHPSNHALASATTLYEVEKPTTCRLWSNPLTFDFVINTRTLHDKLSIFWCVLQHKLLDQNDRHHSNPIVCGSFLQYRQGREGSSNFLQSTWLAANIMASTSGYTSDISVPTRGLVRCKKVVVS